MLVFSFYLHRWLNGICELHKKRPFLKNALLGFFLGHSYNLLNKVHKRCSNLPIMSVLDPPGKGSGPRDYPPAASFQLIKPRPSSHWVNFSPTYTQNRLSSSLSSCVVKLYVSA